MAQLTRMMFWTKYKENNDCEYPKKECSMHGYLIQKNPAAQNIYICLKKKKFKK